MKCSKSHYICGFNGFSQIDGLILLNDEHRKDLHMGTFTVPESDGVGSKPGDEDILYFSVPQKSRTEIKLCTWSNIWTVTGSRSIRCVGNGCFLKLDNLQSLNQADCLNTSIVQMGKHVILQEGSRTTMIKDTGSTCHLTTNIEDVHLLSSTQTNVYGMKDGQGYKGQLEVNNRGDGQTGQATMKLSLDPFTFNIEVKTLSCGFEHTLILTQQGEVYSYGSGSRGQLGHGEVTVDPVLVVTPITTFTGINVVAIAAGGWHSVAITDTGDAYVWGWNQSGQLGLPNGVEMTDGDLKTNTKILDPPTSHEIEIECCSLENKIEAEGCKRKRSDIDVEIDMENSGESGQGSSRKKCNTNLNTDENFKRKTIQTFSQSTDPDDKLNLKSTIVTQNTLDNLKESKDDNSGTTCENLMVKRNLETKGDRLEAKGNIQEKKFDTYTAEEAFDYVPTIQSDIDVPNRCYLEVGRPGSVKRKFPQDLDSLQVHPVPYGLDLPDEMHMFHASCGTRHTCLLTDSGVLLTAGWNAYGQLCHGDSRNRDYFESVTYFENKNEQVVNVKAEAWNTVIITELKTDTE